MDPSLVLMLSNLLQLQNHLDPSLTTSLADSHSSAAPLLFFTIASVLSYAAAALQSRTTSGTTTASGTNNAGAGADSDHDHSISAFRSLAMEHIWAMEPLARDAQWRSSYGLSYPVFASLVDQLKPHLNRANLPLPPDYALSMALSRLTHGSSARSMSPNFKLDPFLIAKTTNTITRLLSTKLYSNYIRVPVSHRLLQTVQAFKELSGLPNICGAIDGSHVKLSRTPSSDPLAFKCRHNFYSVLLQVIADHRHIFWDVCVKAPGSTDDASHFRESLLYARLTSAEILRDSVINVRGRLVRPYIVGDWCYPLLSCLLTPFSPNGTGTPAQNLFDACLMRGRGVVEHALGLLKGRWRILQDLNVDLNHAPQTIVACCVLHNICQIAGEPETPLWKDPKEMGPVARVLESEKLMYYCGESLRQAMADDLQERQQHA
ncbi:protein ALP1-like [Amborella trichopoda]|uniref:DDE Tnp4 domain-containing protein n=1 Tax=Amborella trichopoda TaxID=13333 RepID=W1NMR1_AMBTC|nr:protein ALP1-like [Amborella trichopoda]XP_011629144.1 protein ALP1-like [Amborella trichopoda]ERM96831.1 hypothetical protein AMTR_s00128p00095410 [Amborella trichopoda]|eukprot:XP_006829415.1 protein ALP1-like [Amborella trichopoda]